MLTSLLKFRAIKSDPNKAYSKFSLWQKAIIILIALIIGLLSPLSLNLYIFVIPTITRDLYVLTGVINFTITLYLIL